MVLIIIGGIGYYFWQRNKTSQICGITNCHGLDITCGDNSKQFCDMMYGLGDNCRQYVTCRIQNGKCQQIQNEKFNTCKSCTQKCEQDNINNPEKAFECESTCFN